MEEAKNRDRMHVTFENQQDAKSVLYLLKGIVLFTGCVKDNTLHQHPFIQLSFGLNGVFEIRSDTMTACRKAALVNVNQPHQLDSKSLPCAVLLIDPELDRAGQLVQSYFKDVDICFPPHSLFNPVVQDYLRLLITSEAAKTVTEIVDKTLNLVGGVDIVRVKKSQKIQSVLSLLEDIAPDRIGVKELSGQIGLSESRLIHLFKEEVGMPVRRYILWLRLQKAVKRIIEGATFTSAAHYAGFADSAHLSRTFRRMFGQKMLDIFSYYSTGFHLEVITDLD